MKRLFKNLFRLVLLIIFIVFIQVFFLGEDNLLDEIIDIWISEEDNDYLDIIKDIEEEEIWQEDDSYVEEDIEDSNYSDDIENIRQLFYQALLNGESEFTYKPKNLTRSETEKLDLRSIIFENPDLDLGYRGYNFEYSYIEPYVKEISFNIDYFQEIGKNGENYSRLSKNDLKFKRKILDEKVEEFLNEYINPSMNDLEKELAVHDYIVTRGEYNYEALTDEIVSVDNYNAYGILVNGSGVCDAYAKAFYTLGKAAGLEVKYVAGTARNDGGILGHAWNLVNLAGDWYNVDATWNDPIFVNGDKPKNYVSYKYFNVTDEMIRDSHFRNPEYEDYPKARGTKYGRDNLGLDDSL